MWPTLHSDVVMRVLLAAVWRRRRPACCCTRIKAASSPAASGNDSLKDHQMICSMSRRGNGHDNAVAESFFQLLKRERVKRKTTRRGITLEPMCSIISSCSTTRYAGMATTRACLR